MLLKNTERLPKRIRLWSCSIELAHEALYELPIPQRWKPGTKAPAAVDYTFAFRVRASLLESAVSA